ncbi:MAG: energy-coupling factor transporter ATPase [Lachnospiraceae bacterium]|nr:energy-coupling factor transporter ATPase [Lachnospiraceae bacterium]MBR3036597.1 energy-coupling factor transporter ATPase [Lachnospiraceae bacterium]
MSDLIKIQDLIHEYKEFDEEEHEKATIRALSHVTMSVEQGAFVVILGHNGSGKSTLAKHINALLMPTEGYVLVSGKNTKEVEELWTIRKDAGMVFQNPDNQIIGNVVEEDVAFGPENIGVPNPELEHRVEEALEKVGMTAYRLRSPNQLSGGQKQRIAIAGMLALKPKCILMDEPTAMLDPQGRKEVLSYVHELNRKEGITIVLITHYMEEAVHADRVIVMDGGTVVMDGTPKEIFSRVDELKQYRMTVPAVTELAWQLKQRGLDLPAGILTIEELTEALCSLN